MDQKEIDDIIFDIIAYVNSNESLRNRNKLLFNLYGRILILEWYKKMWHYSLHEVIDWKQK